jgi:hypothetical protein
MKFSYAARVKIVALALVLFNALVIHLNILRTNRYSISDPPTLGQDEISLYERRFEALKRDVPPGSVVGYVEDRPEFWTAKQYYLTQYALMPSVVVYDPTREVIVGNFSNPEKSAEVLAFYKLTTVKDFGNGVMLLGKQK